MATFWNKTLNQTIVYWGTPVSDGWGKYTFADAVEIDGRWIDKTELFMGTNGKEVISSAVVLLGQDVDEEGYLYLGDLDDLDSAEEDDPMTVNGAYKIEKFMKCPDIRGSDSLRKAWL